MRIEGNFIEDYWNKGEWTNSLIFGMLYSDFLNSIEPPKKKNLINYSFRRVSLLHILRQFLKIITDENIIFFNLIFGIFLSDKSKENRIWKVKR